VLAQAREHGMRVGLELRERHRRSEWEGGGAHRAIVFLRAGGAP
jgi:hypothetical protein